MGEVAVIADGDPARSDHVEDQSQCDVQPGDPTVPCDGDRGEDSDQRNDDDGQHGDSTGEGGLRCPGELFGGNCHGNSYVGVSFYTVTYESVGCRGCPCSNLASWPRLWR